MRHHVFGRKLNRDVKERKALFKSLIVALITHGKIKTTFAKAKAMRSLVEKLVTHAKENSTSSLVQIASFLNKKELIEKLVKDIAPRFTARVGGYVRMIKVGKRASDSTEEVILEWTEIEKKLPEVKKEEKKERVTKKAARAQLPKKQEKKQK